MAQGVLTPRPIAIATSATETENSRICTGPAWPTGVRKAIIKEINHAGRIWSSACIAVIACAAVAVDASIRADATFTTYAIGAIIIKVDGARCIGPAARIAVIARARVTIICHFRAGAAFATDVIGTIDHGGFAMVAQKACPIAITRIVIDAIDTGTTIGARIHIRAVIDVDAAVIPRKPSARTVTNGT